MNTLTLVGQEGTGRTKAKILDQNNKIAELCEQIKTLKESKAKKIISLQQKIKLLQAQALKIQNKAVAKFERENEGLKHKVARLNENCIEAQKEVATKRLKTTKRMLKKKRVEAEMKQEEKAANEYLMVKQSEICCQQKEQDQIIKDKS